MKQLEERDLTNALAKIRRVCRIFRMCFFGASIALMLCLAVLVVVTLQSYLGSSQGAINSMIYSLTGGILLLLIAWNFTKLFNEVVVSEAPFSEKQADFLRAIAVIALSCFVLDALFSFGFIFEPAPEIGFGMVANDGIAEPTLNFNVGMLAFSAIMYSLSAIFRYAALLQQLSDETV